MAGVRLTSKLEIRLDYAVSRGSLFIASSPRQVLPEKKFLSASHEEAVLTDKSDR